MASETKLERRLTQLVMHANRPRGAAIVIGVVTSGMTVLAGVLMTVFDRDQFPSIGLGLWWAVQTVTTVGYGDHVPTNISGRIAASVVMLVGIGFISLVTALITSGFVARWQKERFHPANNAASEERLRSIDERLARIEAALEERR